jgi:hypothetical protein
MIPLQLALAVALATPSAPSLPALAAHAFTPLPVLAALPGGGQDPTDPVGAIGQPTIVDGLGCNRVPLCPTIANSNGEAWAGNGLVWITDFNASQLRLVDTASCTVIRSCAAPGGGQPSENTLIGDVLYHYDFLLGVLFRIDAATCAVLGVCIPPGDDLA